MKREDITGLEGMSDALRRELMVFGIKNWTLPRLLPARMLDAELAKQMKLTRR
jgi:hypothetical protein